jgi:hypothetical protein
MKGRRWYFLLALYGALLFLGWAAGHWLPELIGLELNPDNEPMVHAMILTTAVAFIIASAIPFVPGAEIGFGLILMLGAEIAFLVYLSMVITLILAFLMGRFLPLRLVAGFFKRLDFRRAHDLVLQLIPLNPDQRIALLTDSAPRRFVSIMLRHRYFAIVLLFNLPGNSVLGGGGGIAFIAGLSGVFSYPLFMAAVAIAVAPVPLFFYLTGQ